MRQAVDLRHQLGIVVLRANETLRALEALPADAETMQTALDALTPTERRQLADHLTLLAQRCTAIREHCRSVAGQLQLEG